MTDVEVCPKCNGRKRIWNASTDENERCPTCDGKGVVWRTQEAASEGSEQDPTDLTYHQD